MSLITKCPACNTMFRVVPDQLRISGGWVRCGNCDEVFDGNAQLQPTEAPANLLRVPSAPEPQPEPKPKPEAKPEAKPEVPPEPLPEPEPEPEPEYKAMSLAWPSAPTVAAPEPSLEPDLGPGSAPEPDSFLDLPAREHIDLPLEPVAHELNVSPLGIAAAPPPPRYVQADRPDHLSTAAGNLSFMQPPKRRRDKKTHNGIWWLAATSLTLALGLQLVLHERDAIAAAQPGLAPALHTLCAGLGCQVNAYRNIDALIIDNSGFAKVRADTYRLSVTLRNTAPVPIAVPSLELTLSDAVSQPLIRRVLSPAEWGAAQPALASGGELNLNIPVAIASPANGAKFTGYRVLAFYP